MKTKAFYNGITLQVSKGRATDVIYLDCCKAFDTVLHDILVFKLERHIIDRQAVWYIRNWLDGFTLGAAIKNSMSKWKAVTSGAPTGTVLGLILFTSPSVIWTVGSTRSKFTNDTKLCGMVEPLERSNAIQRDL